MALGKIRPQHTEQGIVARCTETRPRVTFNGDASYWRSWRLFATGKLERVNSRSHYKQWIGGEAIPPEMLEEAQRLGITIPTGRKLKHPKK
jgi:hypothetical protein